MKISFIVWCALGLALIGLKAHVDRTQLKYNDVAVKAGSATYFIPRAFVAGDGWRADVMRVAGCWDAREAGVLPVAAGAVSCGGERSLHLRIAARSLGPEADAVLRGVALNAVFWPTYTAPAEHSAQLVQAWAGRGEWAGRFVVHRDDWQLVRLESVHAPWVPLLSGEPQTGDPSELAALYAGRCYRPDALSEIGMTCTVALRLAGGAVIEYDVGPDEITQFATLRDAVSGQAGSWIKP